GRVGVARVGVRVQVAVVGPDALGLRVVALQGDGGGRAPLRRVRVQRRIQRGGIVRRDRQRGAASSTSRAAPLIARFMPVAPAGWVVWAASPTITAPGAQK